MITNDARNVHNVLSTQALKLGVLSQNVIYIAREQHILLIYLFTTNILSHL